MNNLDLEIQIAKQHIKDLKHVRKQYKKVKRLEKQTYNVPVHVFVNDIIDSICFTLTAIVKK